MAETAPPPADAARPARKRSNRIPLIIVVVAICLGILYGIYWAVDGRWHVTTDDAYVHGDTVNLSTQIPGTVTRVDVALTQHVQQGQKVVELDATDEKVALAQAEAQLGLTVRQTAQLYQQAEADSARVTQRRAALQLASANLARARKLVAESGISKQALQQIQTTRDSSAAALNAARHQLAAARAAVGHTDIADHPAVRRAEAAVRKAWVALARTTVLAPISGYVASKNVQVGQRALPGTPILAIVPLNDVYVEANFKENQLDKLRIGQPVKLTSDTYGRGIDYHGTIVGFAAGTGDAMSVLPAQNASGNWIKIVQRLPVRIALEPKQVAKHPLMLGMSMDVNVDVRQHGDGRMLSTARVFDGNTQTDVYAAQTQGVTAAIQQIVARNLPAGSVHDPAPKLQSRR
ncbi:MAG TPA: efflux RND transporter periplasmic adaptor subunit [Nevskiaceae bacterium]|nr:efflux RND transporter periplasmic adaptor subunit [Nevskiaceae bacterium]